MKFSTGDAAISSQSGSAARRALSRNKPIILVAEDSADSREMMQVLLEMKGYHVIGASNGPEAVEAALQCVPDLMLIDLQLPGLNGVEVTRILRRHAQMQPIPILVVSGHDPARFREAAFEAGANEYLLKPLDFDSLDDLLRRVVSAAAGFRPLL